MRSCCYFPSLTLPDVLKADRGQWRGEGQNIPSFSSMFRYHKTHLILLGQDLEIHTHGLLTLSSRTHPSPGQMASLWPLGTAVDIQEIRPQTSTHFMKPEAKQEGGPAWDCSLHSGNKTKVPAKLSLGRAVQALHSCHHSCAMQNTSDFSKLSHVLSHLVLTLLSEGCILPISQGRNRGLKRRTGPRICIEEVKGFGFESRLLGSLSALWWEMGKADASPALSMGASVSRSDIS